MISIVVCLNLGPMLASQHCSHAFSVLTSLHVLSFLLKMFFYYSLIKVCYKNNSNVSIYTCTPDKIELHFIHTFIYCELIV